MEGNRTKEMLDKKYLEIGEKIQKVAEKKEYILKKGHSMNLSVQLHLHPAVLFFFVSVSILVLCLILILASYPRAVFCNIQCMGLHSCLRSFSEFSSTFYI